MQILDVTKTEIDLREYTKRSAQETDYKTLIRENTLIRINGEPAILYMKLEEDLEPLRNCLLSMKFDTTTRSAGLQTQSRVFGYQPRIVLRRDFCTATSLAATAPAKNKIICGYGEKIAPIYKEAFQSTFRHHEDWVEKKVLKEWKLEGTPFTSGIVNKNNPLKYHFDSGNIKGVCSCMIALKKNCGGGFLSIPELGIGLEIADKSLTIFDGQSLLHGVTPIKKLADNTHRYTIVYYTLHQMWKCEPYEQELARIRRIKSEREAKRAGLNEAANVIETQHGVEETDE